MPTDHHRTRYHLITLNHVRTVYLEPCDVDDCTRDHVQLVDYINAADYIRAGVLVERDDEPASNERGGRHATDVADDDVTTVVADALYGADAWAAFTRATRHGQ